MDKMAKQAPFVLRDENGFSDETIPVLFNESVGTLTFVQERPAKFVNNEDGERTDEIRAISVELVSSEQKTNFNVDLPPMFNLSSLNLKYGDEVLLTGVKEATAWAVLPQGSRNVVDAITGFSIIAESMEKAAKADKQVAKDNSEKGK